MSPIVHIQLWYGSCPI